jgi:ABC-type glycerol-3-phosphate transport system substrate-binding protein
MKNLLQSIRNVGLLITVVLCFVTGCGKTDKFPKTGNQAIAEDGTPSGELVYWAQEYNQKNLAACLDMFHQKYPNITFKTQTIPNNELLNKLMVAFSSSEGVPDAGTFSTFYMPLLISTGQLLDISDRISPYIQDINKMSLNQVTQEGKYYAVPLDASPVGIIYNTKIFASAGLDTEPEKVTVLLSTWDKYIEIGKIIRQKTGAGMMTVSGESPDANFFNTLVLQQGAWYNNSSGDFKYNIPETRNTMSLILKMKKAGILEDIPSWTQPWYDAFQNHKIAAYIGEVWMGGFMATGICPDTSGEWHVAPMPMWKEGGSRSSDSCGSSWFITTHTKNPNAAWAAAEFYALNEAAVLKQYELLDQFPTYEKTYDDPFFQQPVAFFGNQKARAIFAELEQSIPSYDINFSKNFALYNTHTGALMQKVLLNNENIDRAVQETESDIVSQM